MLEKFKPLLAKDVDISLLDFESRTYFASPKLDGIRATILDGKVYSRTKKLIPNKYVQHVFGRPDYNGLDGELIVGSVTSPDVYRNTNSGVMSIEGEPDVKFHAFDNVSVYDKPYYERLTILSLRASALELAVPVPHFRVNNLEHLGTIEEEFLLEGYEGLMLRDINMPYKFGRSTAKQQHLLKVKRFEDSEAVILDFDPLLKNENEAVTNELGFTSRSSHQENKVAQELLGRVLVQDLVSGVQFYVGSGFTLSERESLWKDQSNLKGQVIKYKFFPVGMKDGVPRHPIFLGFRDPIDLEI